MTMPKVSIIIPVYNRWPHVKDAINSVIEQNYDNIECIVVDDCSTDGSFSLLKEWAQSQPNITLEQLPENGGAGAARSRGIQLAHSDYIGFLDSDDVLVDGSIANRVELLRHSPHEVGAVFGKQQLSEGEESVTHYSHDEKLILDDYLTRRTSLHMNTVLIRKSVMDMLGGFAVSIRHHQDREFLIRLLCLTEVHYCDCACARMRDLGDVRIRDNSESAAAQGERYINLLETNRALHENASSEAVFHFLSRARRSYLRALYRSRNFKMFRNKYRQYVREGKIENRRRDRKRYWLSIIKGATGR